MGAAGWFKRAQEQAPPARGINALAEADTALGPLPLDLKAILGSSAVRTQLQIYARYDGDAVQQQRRVLRELTLANICLMIAGVAWSWAQRRCAGSSAPAGPTR